MVELDKVKQTNDEIYKMESFVLDLMDKKEEQTELLDNIKRGIEDQVRAEAAQGPEKGGPLSSEVKITAEIKRRLALDKLYSDVEMSNIELSKQIDREKIKITYYKRIFQMMITFQNEYKVNG